MKKILKVLLMIPILFGFINTVNADTLQTVVTDAAYNTSDGSAYFPLIYTSTYNTQKFWTIDTPAYTTHATFKVGNFSSIDKTKNYTISFYILGGPVIYETSTGGEINRAYVNPPIVRLNYEQLCYVRPLGSGGSGSSMAATNVFAVLCDNYTFSSNSFDIVINTGSYTFASSFGISYDFGYIESNQTLQDVVSSNSEIKDSVNDLNDTQKETNNKLDDLNENITSESENFEESTCGIICKLGKLPGKIIDGFIEGLKSLFIPEDGYFENWFNELKLFFEEKLGFLATPFTLIIDFLNMYLNLDADAEIIINIPDITVPNFENHKIISATTFNWSNLLKSKESLNNLWQLYLSFIDVFLILNFISLCETKYNRIFGGDTSNYEYYTVEDSTLYNPEGEITGSRRTNRHVTRKKVE